MFFPWLFEKYFIFLQTLVEENAKGIEYCISEQTSLKR